MLKSIAYFTAANFRVRVVKTFQLNALEISNKFCNFKVIEPTYLILNITIYSRGIK
jgi:hypothetical protein